MKKPFLLRCSSGTWNTDHRFPTLEFEKILTHLHQEEVFLNPFQSGLVEHFQVHQV